MLPQNKLPSHIGFIMDGNGRWASSRGLPRNAGHKAGSETFRKIARYCSRLGIKTVSFYAFSTENWKRPDEEVNAIMRLFEKFLVEIEKYADENTRVIFLGDKSAFSENIQIRMNEIEFDSKENSGMNLMIAINYGGRDEIIHAVKNIGELLLNDKLKISDINEDILTDNLYTKGIPDVDLIIRPSGELRTSNFLIWQSAYAELYFTNILWPDFTEKELDRALLNYASRGRRFGGV